MKWIRAILLLVLMLEAPAYAENPAADDSTPLGEGTSVAEMEQMRAKLLRKLQAKLLNRKGKPVSIVIFSPIDFTTTQVGPTVASTLVDGIKKYGNLNIREEKHILESLTVSEFRRGMAEFKADVLFVTSLRNTNFDLYIYDRRTPYFIYAHSEPIPELTQLQINSEVAVQYTRLLLRRTLYRFINDEYFELPRQDAPPVLQSEIPRWIASTESLYRINREIVSLFYTSVTSGAALAKGAGSGRGWNQHLIGVQLGVRAYKNLFIEGSYLHSAYNILVGGPTLIFANKESPYQIGVGLGLGYSNARKVWPPDATASLGRKQFFIVPSVKLLFPIGDAYLKLEHQVFFEPNFEKFLFTLMPGIQLFF